MTLRDLASSLIRGVLGATTKAAPSTQSTARPRPEQQQSSSRPRHRARSSTDGAGAGIATAGETITEYDVAVFGLPRIEHAPEDDGDADPGEVVWAWVPYEDDPAQGKDRPVLIIGHGAGALVGLQTTSKDKDRDRASELRRGRVWLDIGSGSWDSKGRESEVRVDRLLRVPAHAVRREGAALDIGRFDAVVAALRALHP